MLLAKISRLGLEMAIFIQQLENSGFNPFY